MEGGGDEEGGSDGVVKWGSEGVLGTHGDEDEEQEYSVQEDEKKRPVVDSNS